MLAPKQQVALALDAVFGAGKPRQWSDGEVTLVFGEGQVVWTGFGPVLVAKAKDRDASPTGSGALGLFYLRVDRQGTFRLSAQWPDAVAGSIMGVAPEWNLRHDLAEHPVIEARAGGVWQGYACSTTTLVELTPSGPRQRATFPSAYDSSAAATRNGDHAHYNGTITHAVRNLSFDLRITGTNSFTQHFLRRGETYIRVPEAYETLEESALPTC